MRARAQNAKMRWSIDQWVQAHDGRSFKQLRVMVSRFDADGNGRLSFEEWACVVFDKSFGKVHGPRL